MRVDINQLDPALKGLVFQLLESASLSFHRFLVSTCIPTARAGGGVEVLDAGTGGSLGGVQVGPDVPVAVHLAGPTGGRDRAQLVVVTEVGRCKLDPS